MSILIDSTHLFFRNFWMNKNDIVVYAPDENQKSVPTGEINTGYMAHVIYASILVLINKFKASKDNQVYLALDSKPSWRHDYYVEHSKQFPEYNEKTYKGDRNKHDELPFDEIWKSYNIVMENLAQCSDFHVIKVDKAEADDIIAVLAINSINEDVYVCSSDKDFHQLQRENVHIYDPIKKIIIPKIDIERRKQLHFLVAGDDNIKAVKPRCGIKTAEKMLQEGLDDILKSDPEIRARYEFNRTLIDFDYIPEYLVKNIKETVYNTKDLCYNGSKLMAFFAKYKMKMMLSRINQFKLKNEQDKFVVPSKSQVSTIVDNSIKAFFS